MPDLHPSLWRTCRVLANANRVGLLWRLFELEESSMGRLAEACGLGGSSACMHLRALNARGLIRAERRRTHVFYRPVANPEVAHAVALLGALRRSHADGDSAAKVIRAATAFTHPRRIEVVRSLGEGAKDFSTLAVETGISVPALARHVAKLAKRDILKRTAEGFALLPQSDPLCACLLRAAMA